jgi:hypothetical protein
MLMVGVKRFVAALLILSDVLVANEVNAAPVTWTLTSSFASPTTVTGTYSYDSDTNAYSNVNLTYYNGTTYFPITYAISSYSQNVTFVGTVNGAIQNVSPAVSFGLVSPMTNGGGTIQAINLIVDTCQATSNGQCTAVGVPHLSNLALSASVTGVPLSPIPSLSEWAQLMLALMVMTVIGWHFHRERSY